MTALRREICRNRPELFTAIYLKGSLPLRMPEFHVEIYSDIADRSLKKCAVVAPTGFGKSCVISFAAPLWMTCYQHYKQILYISASGGFASDRVRAIRAEVENNELLKQDFGLKPGELWKDDEIFITVGDDKDAIRIMSRGKGSQTQGMRPDMVLLDDLEDDEAVRSETKRAHLKEWLNLVIFNRITPQDRIFVIGSLLSKLSYINNLLGVEGKQQGWTGRVYKAQVGGRSTWQERFSDEDIETRKRDLLGMPGAFEAMYQADVSKIQKYTFQSIWLRRWDRLPSDRFPLFAYIDPAVGENIHHDFTAISVGGMDLQNNLWVVDFIKKRFNVETLELFNLLFAWYDRYKLKGIGIETNGFQKFLKVFFDLECKRLGKFPSIIEVVNGGKTNKAMRIASLAPLMQQGKIIVGRHHHELIAEVEGYPEVENDDGLDSLAGLKDLAVPGKISSNRGVAPRYQPSNPSIGF